MTDERRAAKDRLMAASPRPIPPRWVSLLRLVVVTLVLGAAIGAGVWWALALLWHAIWGEGPMWLPG
ncbi:hypothetical protein Mco01_39640 [Microbispora corallina]|uniref:Uncharacterized protein n=1 Tax=Microbispora corallina TaxID=83302 RepID=A0ABQ4G1P5_9ACTN|nr:hypothetical protein [Microbispora corallina]GIH40964.1 hypothetical protein Mco01_39640 [Microbispora corallina]